MIMDGKQIKLEIIESIKNEVSKIDDKIGFTVIQVGDNPASNVYINSKKKMCEDVGYNFQHLKYDENVSEETLIKVINKLNKDKNTYGILVQLPLPKHLNENRIINMIDHAKDVDGLTYLNSGKLIQNKDCLVSCTPYGISKMLDYYNIDVKGKHVVILGRSVLVGKPVANLLLNKDATVTICHSKTNNLKDITRLADILIVAIGKPKYITKDMVKDNAIVIDVGINRLDTGLCGDVDYDSVKNIASYITPVPGGVGQLTIASLAENILKAYKINKE